MRRRSRASKPNCAPVSPPAPMRSARSRRVPAPIATRFARRRATSPPAGAALVDAEVSASDLASARELWRRRVWSAVAAILGVTLLVCALPTIERRRRITRGSRLLRSTLTIAAIVVGAFAILLVAAQPFAGQWSFASPPSLLLSALTAGALAWLALDHVERRRVSNPRPRLHALNGSGLARLLATWLTCGFAVTLWIALYERALRQFVAGSSLDVLHFSLHPLSAARLAVAFGLVLLHVAVLWI